MIQETNTRAYELALRTMENGRGPLSVDDVLREAKKVAFFLEHGTLAGEKGSEYVG